MSGGFYDILAVQGVVPVRAPVVVSGGLSLGQIDGSWIGSINSDATPAAQGGLSLGQIDGSWIGGIKAPTGGFTSFNSLMGVWVDSAVEIAPPQPPTGGGGSSGYVLPGVNLPSPTPPVDKSPLYLEQALQEDQEIIILLKSLAEVIQWH